MALGRGLGLEIVKFIWAQSGSGMMKGWAAGYVGKKYPEREGK